MNCSSHQFLLGNCEILVENTTQISKVYLQTTVQDDQIYSSNEDKNVPCTNHMVLLGECFDENEGIEMHSFWNFPVIVFIFFGIFIVGMMYKFRKKAKKNNISIFII